MILSACRHGKVIKTKLNLLSLFQLGGELFVLIHYLGFLRAEHHQAKLLLLLPKPNLGQRGFALLDAIFQFLLRGWRLLDSLLFLLELSVAAHATNKSAR